MTILARENRIEAEFRPIRQTQQAPLKPFQGFAAPTSNTTYTPNQFFDVCIPHSSRGVVRLVAYMIRKTLGWCDADGNPREEQILIPYQELVTHAGISREMIRLALDEAISGNYIRCVQTGRSKSSGDGGQTALYELMWDDGPEYVKDPKRFRGFFEGEGNRTDIPNEFFDRVIPHESLALIKVVGSIIRFSIGFQARRGRRRQQVQLSYRHIQRYARIQSRTTLGAAMRTALQLNYIVRLEEGFFDLNDGQESRAAIYALKWADSYVSPIIGQKNGPGQPEDDRSEIRPVERSEKWTVNGQKNGHEDRSEKRPDIEMKHRNETFKQQAEPVDADVLAAAELLQKQGFDAKSASALASRYPKNRIEEQIDWLPLRMPDRNPLGMLRFAIEENWPNPAQNAVNIESPGAVFASHFYAGYAGNEGLPTAEPSKRDAMLAERYVKRIQELAPEELKTEEWGRAFGRMMREDFPAREKTQVSLAWALRISGDSFYLRHSSRIKAERSMAWGAKRSTHELQHRSTWIDYIKTQEERLKEEKPEDYARFVAYRADGRKQIQNSPWRMGIEQHLARFDANESRLMAFQGFFKTHVLDFWKWDAGLNPYPLNQTQPTP